MKNIVKQLVICAEMGPPRHKSGFEKASDHKKLESNRVGLGIALTEGGERL